MNARQPASANDYLGAFRRVASVLPGQQLDWLRESRAEAIGRFAQQGFPTLHDEEWKYTSVSSIEHGRFNVLPPRGSGFLSRLVDRHALADSHLLVFVNGHLEPDVSRLGQLPAEMKLTSLNYRLERHPDDLEAALVTYPPASAFADLNLAFMTDGAYVRLAPGCIVKAPIQLLFIASEANLAIQPRNLVRAGAGSSASIVEHHVAAGEFSYFTNAVTDIELDSGASIEHHKLQQESPTAFHIATVNVSQAAKSKFVSSSFALGARLARAGIAVKLQAEDAHCELHGLYLTDGRQHVDHHTRIDHLQPRCTSRESYKGVVNGASRAVFNGRVVVHPDAQGSDAVQTNHNLLLSENAEIDTKPQLEIWADDVKCSHGATVGQLDEDQVFYLCSRGIGQSAARAMLTRAFALEVVNRVSLPSLQERLDELLQLRLPQQ
ncbi:MAG: Fe-S cluster assembly protein SufD [Azonexus sp.]|nr:Fe-S cluster assembly protein SufD [Azonexus sp.]